MSPLLEIYYTNIDMTATILCTIFISSSPLYVPTVVLILLCSFTRKQNKKKMPPSVTCFGIELLSSTPQEMKNRDWIGLLLKTGWQDQFHQHSHSYLIAMQLYTHNYVSIYVYSIIIMIKNGFANEFHPPAWILISPASVNCSSHRAIDVLLRLRRAYIYIRRIE